MSRLSEAIRHNALGKVPTRQIEFELRAADEIERLEKRVAELHIERTNAEAKLNMRFRDDPDMAFDDQLGWLHKDSLAVVNELRRQLADLRKKHPIQELRKEPCGP